MNESAAARELELKAKPRREAKCHARGGQVLALGEAKCSR